MPPPTTQDLARRAEEHQAIIDELASIEWAPPALKDNEAAIASLKERIDSASAQIAILHKKTKSEHKDFAKLQNSAGRRLLVKLRHGGKKEAVELKLQKEEREFVEALQAEQAAEEARGALQAEKERLEAQNPELRVKAARHEQLRTRLDLLYKSLFTGYTPDYPYEDEAEEHVRQAEDANANFQTVVNQESQVLTLLANAKACLLRTQQLLLEAQSWNYNDMFGGGFFSDMFENNALIDAKAYACRAQALVQEARKKQPMVRLIDAVDVAQLDFLVNIVFDNIFTDIMFAEKIQASLRSVHHALQTVTKDQTDSNARLASANRSLKQTTLALAERRKELEEIRRTILQALAGGEELPAVYREGREGLEVDVTGPDGEEEVLPAYERVEGAGKPRTPGTARSTATTSTTGATLSVYSPPAGAPSSRPGTPQATSRPVTPNSINRLNPYAGALLARAEAQGQGSRSRSPSPAPPGSWTATEREREREMERGERSVSQLIRDRSGAVAHVPPLAGEKTWI